MTKRFRINATPTGKPCSDSGKRPAEVCCPAQMERLHGTRCRGCREEVTRACSQGAFCPTQALASLAASIFMEQPSQGSLCFTDVVSYSGSVQMVDAERPKVTQMTRALIRSWFSANRALPSANTLNIDTQSRVGQGVQECCGSSKKGAASSAATVCARWL